MNKPNAKATFTEEEVTLITKYLNLSKIILGFVGLFEESNKVNLIIDKITTPEPMETEVAEKVDYDKVGDVFEQ
jgi:hypothetical protein